MEQNKTDEIISLGDKEEKSVQEDLLVGIVKGRLSASGLLLIQKSHVYLLK